MQKKRKLEAAKIFEQLVNRKTQFRSGGKVRTGRSLEITALSAIAAAVKGSIESVELLLHMHDHSVRYGDFKAETEVVSKPAGQAVKRRTVPTKPAKAEEEEEE